MTDEQISIPEASTIRMNEIDNRIDTQVVTLNKLAANKTTSGYLVTYELLQGSTSLGKIDIPKDFLVKSATLQTCATTGTPTGMTQGDKYIDFVINVKEGSTSDSHVYLKVTDLVDVYTADNSTLQLSNNQFSIKKNGITVTQLASSVYETGYSGTSGSKLVPTNDSRLSNARTPTSHSHGNITNDGKVGTVANKPLITGTNGVVQAGSFGTTANTFCQGNDSRLSDSRTPKFNLINASSTDLKDLDDYVTGGFYYCSSDGNIAPYISNCPLTGSNNKSFFLLVETWGEGGGNYVKQTLTYYHNNVTYVRTKAGSKTGWVAWRKTTEVAFNPTKTTGIEVGTLTINGVATKIYQQDTTYSTATESDDGLMSSTDKIKLDGIATGANKITVDSALSTTSTNPVQNKVINTSLGNKVDKVSGSTNLLLASGSNIAQSNFSKLNGAIPNTATSFKDYNLLGYYTCSNTVIGNIEDKPFSGNYVCLIENKQYSDTYFIQFCYKMANSSTSITEIYFRKRTNSYWTDWSRLISDNDSRLSDNRKPKNIELGTVDNPYDLNSLSDAGFYFGNRKNSLTVTNTPDDTYTKRCVIFVESFDQSTTYFKQTLTYFENGKIYVRLKYGTQWHSWTEITTIDDIPTKLSQLTNDLSKSIVNNNIADNTIELGKLNANSVADSTSGGTSGSSKLITSGAVYSGLSGKIDKVSENKNVILADGSNTAQTNFLKTAGTGLTKTNSEVKANIGNSSSTSSSQLVACNDTRLSDKRDILFDEVNESVSWNALRDSGMYVLTAFAVQNADTSGKPPLDTSNVEGNSYLLVEGIDRYECKQTLTISGKIFIRTCINLTWSDWQEIYTNENIPSASTSQAGIVQLGTGSSNAATGNHNHNNTYATLSHSHTASDLPTASTNAKGIVQLINNLTTDSSDKALTAAQGKELATNKQDKLVTTNYNTDNSKFKVYKYGNVVTVYFNGWTPNVSKDNQEHSTNIQLPSGYRPPTNVFIGSPSVGYIIRVATDGIIYCNCGSNINTISDTQTWVIE